MTALNISGHRLAKRAAPNPNAGRQEFMLTAAGDQFLHQSGQQLTYNRAYAWRGNRDQMRAMLEGVPEGLRKRLRPIALDAPRPARKA